MAKQKTKKDEAPREHKKPWQETYATPEEIKAMLDSRVSLRYNEVRGIFVRVVSSKVLLPSFQFSA